MLDGTTGGIIGLVIGSIIVIVAHAIHYKLTEK